VPSSASAISRRSDARESMRVATGASSRRSRDRRAHDHGTQARDARILRAAARRQARDRTHGREPWGFFDQELTRRTRDWKEIYDYGPPDGEVLVPQWPSALPGFRATIERSRGLRRALRLLHVVALNLGMPATALDNAFRPDTRFKLLPRCLASGPTTRPSRRGFSASTITRIRVC
jgi:hypothetical protein